MASQKGPGKKARGKYHKPKLTKYGKLKDLTAGGTGKAMEPSAGLKPRP